MTSAADPEAGRGMNTSVARRIAVLFRPYLGRVSGAIAAILVTAGLGVINPYLLQVVIDDAIPDGNLNLLYLLVGLMIVLPIVSGLIGVGQSYLNNTVGQSVMRDLRVQLYSHLQRQSLRFFTATRTGEIQSRISNDVNGVQQVVTNTASTVVSNIATVASTLVIMFIIDIRLTLLSLVLTPIFSIITRRVGRIRRELSSQTQKRLADMTATTQETLSVSGVLLTKTFGRQEDEIERFAVQNDDIADLQVRQQMIGRWFFMLIGTAFSIMPALIYLVAGRAIINGDPNLTIGAIVAFTTLQSRLFMPLGQLFNVQVEIQSAMAMFDRIFEYLDLEPEIYDEPGAVSVDPDTVRGQVEFRDVSFSYTSPNGRRTLQELDMAIEHASFMANSGQLIALVGPSGAGKSTLTQLLARLYDVTDGAILIDGRDVRAMTLESLGAIIGMVTQENYLFHASIRQNLTYGRPDATEAEMIAATKAAAIHDLIAGLPEGYDTVVGERGYRMSGGEKQRLALARVILKDPRILILDEATSALDTRSERLIQTALGPLMEDRTTIAIAHRLSTIIAADQILVIEDGKIIERGGHDELLLVDGLYAALYREQFGAGTIEARCEDGIVERDGAIRYSMAAAD
jgi:ATP-binding cassette subfamily B protein